jgi:hypothetical protein
MPPGETPPEAFIDYWSKAEASERALQASPVPVTPTQLAKRFLRAKPADLAEILETLVTLGRAHREGETYSASK